MSSLAVVIMAAGKGTRMKNPDIAKVMYPVGGKPMVEHVTSLALGLRAVRTVVVVGWRKDAVIAHLARAAPGAVCVAQEPQLGTGHAVMQAERALDGFGGDVLVLSGDVPLLREETVRDLVETHRRDGAAATVLTTIMEDPTGYGRIIRAPHAGDPGRTGNGAAPEPTGHPGPGGAGNGQEGPGRVTAIIEQKDASPEQRAIREINSGIYVFRKQPLFEGLAHITPENAQKEYYLTDVFGYFWKKGLPVSAVICRDPREIMGVNTLEQLEQARDVIAARSHKG